MARAVRDDQHGTRTGYVYGCRCVQCRGANRGYAAALRDQRATEPTPAHVHGTTGGYYNWGCRCDRCAEVSRVATRRLRAARRARPMPPHVHGTINGYTNYACRCDDCRGAGRRYRAEWRVTRG